MNHSYELVDKLPKMKVGKELVDALSVFPEYCESICHEDQAVKLMALSDLYRIYIPSQMSIEIYSKLYLAQTVDKVPAKVGIFDTFSRLSGIIIIRKAVLLC